VAIVGVGFVGVGGLDKVVGEVMLVGVEIVSDIEGIGDKSVMGKVKGL
jgi:hypothetical protein